MTNAELLAKLDEWARGRKIWPKSFACEHYRDCNASLQQQSGLHLKDGYTCSMSYVGRDYGLELAPNKRFRLVFVGIDPGANYEVDSANYKPEDLGDFVENQKGIEKWFYNRSFEGSYQYYLGLVRTAAAILGTAGKPCFDQCYQRTRCLGKERSWEPCVVRSFAQANLAKCAPMENGSRDSASTIPMFNKCPPHLVSEIDALEADLVVCHGRHAKWAFPKAVEESGYKHAALAGSPKDDSDFQMVNEVRTPDGTRKYLVLYLKHPGHNQLNTQWNSSVVERALEYLRSEKVIPRA